MPISSLLKLIGLAAIWGGSFLFMRIAAPVLGPVLLIQLRLVLAAVFLLALALLWKKKLDLRSNWKHFIILGLFNTAVPFLLFAWAAKSLPASLMSVLNATTPIWGAVFGAIWMRTSLSLKTLAGLAMGIIGVAVLVGLDGGKLSPVALLAVGAGLAAAACYAVAALYSKVAKSVDAFSNAHGSMWAATLMVAPATPFFPVISVPNIWVVICVLMLGILCSGIAYVLYFKLIDEVGAASAMTVTFLVPVFGVLWGSLILHEHVGWISAVGGVLIVTGTALITGFSPSVLLKRKAVTAE
jgi:drug/metabolite transporter (DMT)-like permease